MSGKEILASIKGHNSVTHVWKIMPNNPKLDPVIMNAYIKFGEILSFCSQDIDIWAIMKWVSTKKETEKIT